MKGAIETQRAFLNQHANHRLAPEATYALGAALQDAGQAAEAAQVFQQFLAKPELARHELAGEVRLRLGMALYDQKKYAEAEQQFASAAAIEGFAYADAAMLRQTECRRELRAPAEALTILNEFLKKFPQSAYQNAARLAAGKCLHQLEKWDETRQMLEPVVQAGAKESIEAAYWLGRTLLKQNRPQEALPLFEAALAKNPQGEYRAYLEIARSELYAIPARRKETAELYRRFAGQHPEHPLTAQALYLSAFVSLEQQDFAAARREGEAFLAKPQYAAHELAPAVTFLAAEGHLLGAEGDPPGDRQRAEAPYRQLIEKYPDHVHAPRANLRLGYLLLADNKPEEATALLSGVLPKLAAPASGSTAPAPRAISLAGSGTPTRIRRWP